MAFSILGELYPRENEVITEVRKSRGGWPGFEVLKFLHDADLRHVESLVRCHRKYKNDRIKVDLR